jgi:hypothetical protein
MADAGNMFPPEFSDLEPYRDWSVTTEVERIKLRANTSDDELRDFYDAMMPRMEQIATYLNGFPLGDMPNEARHLFDLAKFAMEVANLAENGRSPGGLRFDVTRFVPMHDKGVR